MMTVELFQEKIAAGEPLEGAQMVEFMRDQSEVARRLTMELNNKYHTPEEIRLIFEEITGGPIPESFRIFPPR